MLCGRQNCLWIQTAKIRRSSGTHQPKVLKSLRVSLPPALDWYKWLTGISALIENSINLGRCLMTNRAQNPQAFKGFCSHEDKWWVFLSRLVCSTFERGAGVLRQGQQLSRQERSTERYREKQTLSLFYKEQPNTELAWIKKAAHWEPPCYSLQSVPEGSQRTLNNTMFQCVETLLLIIQVLTSKNWVWKRGTLFVSPDLFWVFPRVNCWEAVSWLNEDNHGCFVLLGEHCTPTWKLSPLLHTQTVLPPCLPQHHPLGTVPAWQFSAICNILSVANLGCVLRESWWMAPPQQAIDLLLVNTWGSHSENPTGLFPIPRV